MQAKSLTTIVAGITFAVLITISALFIVNSNDNSNQAAIREIVQTFDYQNKVAELSLMSTLKKNSERMSSISEQIAEEITINKDLVNTFKKQLQQFSLEGGTIIDIIALVKSNSEVLSSLHSPLSPATDRLLSTYINNYDFDPAWQLAVNLQHGQTNAALINALPIIEQEYGQVMAYIVFGITINENAPLLNKIRFDSEAEAVELIVGKKTLATAFTGEFINYEKLIYRDRTTSFSSQDSWLTIRSFINNSIHSATKSAYQYNEYSLIFTSAFLCFLGVFIIKAICTTEIKSLRKFIKNHEVENKRASYSGIIKEFNDVAKIISTILNKAKEYDSKKKLTESQQQQILNNTSAVIYIKDIEGNYLFINKTFENLFDIKLKNIYGKSDYDIFPSAQAEAFRKNDSTVISTKDTIEIEEIAPHGDGYHSYISVKFPLYDDQQDIYAVCGISTDITAQKDVENTVKNLQSNLSLTVNSLPCSLVVVNNLLKITEWNAAAEVLTGIDRESALDKNLLKLIPRLNRYATKIVIAIQNNTAAQLYDQPIITKNTIKYEHIYIQPLDTEEATGAVICIYDVTKHTKSMKLNNQKHSMDSIRNLSNKIYHDYYPLTRSITKHCKASYINSKKTYDKEVCNGQEGMCNSNISSSSQPTSLTTQAYQAAVSLLNNLEKLPTCIEKSIEYSNHRLDYLLETCIEATQTSRSVSNGQKLKRIRIQRQFSPQLIPIPCDKDSLTTAISNILINAIESIEQASPEEPEIIIRTKHDTLLGSIRIEIEDNGLGMEENQLTHLYEPFYSTKAGHEGTGLTHAFYTITTQHQGSIQAISKLGSSCLIIIELPEESC